MMRLSMVAAFVIAMVGADASRSPVQAVGLTGTAISPQPAGSPILDRAMRLTQLSLYGATAPRANAFPKKHAVEGGSGTYDDPSTCASGDKDLYPSGVLLFVPWLSKYCVLEDDYVPADIAYQRDLEPNLSVWIGNGSSVQALSDCLGEFRRLVPVAGPIPPPASFYHVDPDPLSGVGKNCGELRTISPEGNPDNPLAQNNPGGNGSPGPHASGGPVGGSGSGSGSGPGDNPVPGASGGSSSGPTVASAKCQTRSPQLAAYWNEGAWGGETATPLDSLPGQSGVTVVDVAFETLDGGKLGGTTQGYASLAAGAQKIHQEGGCIVISLGGAADTAYSIPDPDQFVDQVAAFFGQHPGVYDGVDFDGEATPYPAAQVVAAIKALRKRFPTIIISYAARIAGADPGKTGTSQYQGQDIPVLQQAGDAIDWVGVMAYDEGSASGGGGWKPSTHPGCTYSYSAMGDDCFLDIMQDFSKLIPPSKLILGLMVPTDDNQNQISTLQAISYANWVKSNGYRGVFIWTIPRDPKFQYLEALAGALGT
jgi:chitinase